MHSLRNMLRRSFACVCAAAALVKFHAFVGIKKHGKRNYKLQSPKDAYSDRFVTMAQDLLMASGYDENVTRVALTLALAEKENEIREALEEAATKHRLLQLKYLSVSSRFWLETLFKDFWAFARATHVSFGLDTTYSGISRHLANNPEVWQAFAAHENMSLVFPFNESFPEVSRSLLYGRLSDQVHEPPGSVVLRLWYDTEYTGEVYLLRYSRKLRIITGPQELSRAWADLMKPDRRP
ncbi:unnamed protein product [Symbiodinium natans]|uniref:Uncharacterized protein n=1 Tax=Symbiodinium natans TaxID=878477 RepID=A0A812IG34_9DINO|nr:unnamed protein product [Symbiodinium natans]